jgi:hypothetical protein
MAINEKQSGDFGYNCTYRGKHVEVYAKTTLAARDLAAKHFKAQKAYEVYAVVVERPDGEGIVHIPVD